MKRGKKLIVLLGVLVVLLGAAYAAAQLNPEKEEETVYTTIFTLDPEQVTALTWHYSEEVPLVKEEDGWVYEEDPQFPLDTTYVDAMLTALSQIDSSKTIENVENWDEYTLEAPICEINLTVDGEDVTIKVGEETGLGGQRYVSIGDENAYLVDNSFLEPFKYGLYDVLKMEEIPEMDTPVRLEHEADGDSFTIEKQEDSSLAYSDEYIWFLGEKALDTDLTESLLEQKISQYPSGVGDKEELIREKWLGGRTADCVGLIKSYGWLDADDLRIRYGSGGMPDIGADAMYYNAQVKGSLDTMPETPGLAVWRSGHIGVYVGNGEVIEAMGTAYGVVRTKLAERSWTAWLEIPYIQYD